MLSYVKGACQCFQAGFFVLDDLFHASTLECIHANHTNMAIHTHTLHADRKIGSQTDTRIDTDTHQNVLNGSKIHEYMGDFLPRYLARQIAHANA